MMKCPYRAIRGSLIVDQESDENYSESGIFLSHDGRTFREGTVVSVGPECTEYRVGDRIKYVKEAGYPLSTSDTDKHTWYYIDNIHDVYVKLI